MNMSNSTSLLDTIYGPDLAIANDLDPHTAASVGDLGHILDNAATFDLEMVNGNSWTPLMYAAYYDHTHLVEYLLNSSVSVAAKNDKGRTPLMMSAMCGNVSSTETLVRRCGGEMDRSILKAVDKAGYTALFHASSCGHKDVTKILLEAGSDPNIIEESQGHSMLMVACKEGHDVIAQYLVHFGADLNYSNILGENARSVAAKKGNDAILKFMNKIQKASSRPSVLDGPAQLAKQMEERAKNDDDDHVSTRGGGTDEMTTFLEKAGVEKYSEKFRALDMRHLLGLKDQDLKDLGVTLLGPRRKLTAAIARERARLGLEDLESKQHD